MEGQIRFNWMCCICVPSYYRAIDDDDVAAIGGFCPQLEQFDILGSNRVTANSIKMYVYMYACIRAATNLYDGNTCSNCLLVMYALYYSNVLFV